MIFRKEYLNQLKRLKDKPQIKVLTGLRRSGKSSILMMLKQELLTSAIGEQNIHYLNLESFEHRHLTEGAKLYEALSEKILKQERNYLLLDEIQEVNQWEKAINALQVDFNVDIYLTGSNSNLLSSELATYIAGRYVEISVYTLSFEEFLVFEKEKNQNIHSIEKSFDKYLKMGGMPVIHAYDYDESDAHKVVQDIFASVILNDTIQRFKIRDIELLNRVVLYVFDSIGNTFSGKNIADYFKSQQRSVDVNTIYNYLSALESTFLTYKVQRYNIKGKEILKTQEKYYIGDLSLLYAHVGFRSRQISGILENLVFLELKRRGYKVYVGKIDNREIDFVAEKVHLKMYIQVCYKLENEETISREFGGLLAITDQYPKYVVSMDDYWSESIQGVKHIHIRDFLLDKNL